jgi:hypothetical protein
MRFLRERIGNKVIKQGEEIIKNSINREEELKSTNDWDIKNEKLTLSDRSFGEMFIQFGVMIKEGKLKIV